MQNKTFEEIKENKLFAWIDPAYTGKIKIDQKKFLSYKEGTIIYRINDESNYIFLVVEGEVKLKNYHYTMGSTDPAVIKIKNDFFGEKEIIYRSPRSSVAVANSDCLLYGLSIKDLPKSIIRKLYYLNNAAFPEQEYLPDEIPDIKNIKETGKPRFLRVEAPGRMEFCRELQKMPAGNAKTFSSSLFTVVENKIERHADRKTEEIKIRNPSQLISAFFSREDYDSNYNFSDKLTCINNLADFPEEERLRSRIWKTADIFIRIGSSGPAKTFLDKAAGLLTCQKCDLFVADTVTNELVRWDPLNSRKVKFKIGLAMTGAAAERKEIIISNDLKCEARFIPEYEGIEDLEINSILCLPLFEADNSLLAVLRFANKLNGGFTIEDKKYLELMSPFFSLFIENKLNLPAEREEEHFLYLNDFTDQNNSAKPEIECTAQALENCFKALAGYAESRNVKLLKKFNAEGVISADTKKFRRACFYIIRTLCHEMPGGGKIYIKTGNEDSRIKVEFKFCPKLIQQSPPAFFERDFKENDNPGLEFSITRSIIDSLGGTFEINNLSQEASVIISLPLKDKLTASNR